LHPLRNALVSNRERPAVRISTQQIAGHRIEVMQCDASAQRRGYAIEDRQIVAVASGGDDRANQRLALSLQCRFGHRAPLDAAPAEVGQLAHY
jgi:hypothetical protein